ncbi:hypothetical protein CLSA_c43250 [Clostridium saccharobutylicum DSM 13864]|uniref:Uncharacterized protein n=1 Tax=Clostridium saccharobutylicum DSM 13864 TaxID=1345695 RepID=U5MXG9_CLOSA|nr:hypothetical protein CLSA_c43250 [Clostridium saccharobutylicum DSM 13864]MBA9008181.1 hypothetical protein [Clostridium saccharobutylicum]NOV78074.1 hypothetical protein [Clostridium saccharobutylicum]NOV82832.1 hypothetical protein [Clostridium saccharobutylicum]NSB87177.1 hypothetical protein [Clostridium saccharobutylicum]
MTKSKDLNRGIILTIVLVAALLVYFFYSSSDLPFVYSQF